MTSLLARRPVRPGARAVGLVSAVVTAVTAAAVLIAHLSAGAGSVLAWSDEFDGARYGAPAASTWHFATGGNGWGNDELECYTDSRANSALDGHGDLVLTARYDPGHVCADGSTRDYTSARLLTANLRTMRYGSVRVRAKLPSAPGIWPAIWALGGDHDTVGWPRSGEIDICEQIGSQPNVVHGSLHGPDATGQPYTVTATTVESGVPGSRFHVYGVDWTPDAISFSVDGQVYETASRAEVEAQGTWEFDKPFYLLLNVAVGGTWPGPPSPATTWPQRMIVDYVRVYH